MNSAVCLLDRAAEKYGDKTAFEDKDTAISFTGLRDKGRILASSLMQCAKTGRRNPVIVYMPKSINAVISFMGIMYAGSPYSSINYEMPAARLEKIVQSIKPAAIITDSDGMKRIETIKSSVKIILFDDLIKEGTADDEAVDAALREVRPQDPMYILFTSGSTGTPKGAAISHRGMLDHTEWVVNTFDIGGTDIFGLNSPFHFNNATFDMYTTLYTGAKTLIIPDVLFMYPERLMDYVAENDVSCIFWVPTTLIRVANSGVLDSVKLPNLKYVLFCGEVMPNKQLNIWRKALPHCVYVNIYGSTETNLSIYYVVDRELDDNDPLPIGKPCGNMRAMVLTDDNRIAAVNEPGEICVSAYDRSLEYWNEPEISSRVFVQNPVNGTYKDKIYRTGDLGYMDADGNIVYIGRRDFQIKLNGIRIEPGEIESAASTIDGVERACALLDTERKEILLFVETGEEISERKFRSELRKYIPGYMIPKKVIAIKSFPHTPSGKIDRVSIREKYIANRKDEK